MLVGNVPTFELKVEHKTQTFRFFVRDAELTAGDDLYIEGRKGTYLGLAGVEDPDEFATKKARALAKFELLVMAGVGDSADNIAASIIALPTSVINTVLSQYNERHNLEKVEDAGNS